MSDLTLATLQQATQQRIPLFRSKDGSLTHRKPDGSDWTPADWLAATLGELGEFARERIDFETGQLSAADYRTTAPKELADVQLYLSALATRALDETAPRNVGALLSPAEVLMEVVANLGEWANMNKKRQRGELSEAMLRAMPEPLDQAMALLQSLRDEPFMADSAPVTKADPKGVDLGEAVTAKYNEVSKRVGAPLFLENGALQDPPECPVRYAQQAPVQRPPDGTARG